jgi:hypothetical protein
MSESITIHLSDIWQQAKCQLFARQLIDQTIQQRLVTIAAQQRGIAVSLEELQASADRLRMQHQLLTTQSTLAWLERHQLSIEDFEDIAQFTLLSEKVKAQVVESQIAPYFYQHQLDYEQAILYEVILPQHELAMELFYALQERELDFLAVVHRYGGDRRLRLSGAYRRVIRRRDVAAELSAMIFAATAPQILRPFVQDDRTHLIYVVELIQPELTELLQAEIRQVLFQQWLQQQQQQQQYQVNLILSGTV